MYDQNQIFTCRNMNYNQELYHQAKAIRLQPFEEQNEPIKINFNNFECWRSSFLTSGHFFVVVKTFEVWTSELESSQS